MIPAIAMIVYFYFKYVLPLILTIGIVFTLVGMLINLGSKMSIGIMIFGIGILCALYIIYGNKLFSFISGDKDARNLVGLPPQDQGENSNNN